MSNCYPSRVYFCLIHVFLSYSSDFCTCMNLLNGIMKIEIWIYLNILFIVKTALFFIWAAWYNRIILLHLYSVILLKTIMLLFLLLLVWVVIKNGCWTSILRGRTYMGIRIFTCFYWVNVLFEIYLFNRSIILLCRTVWDKHRISMFFYINNLILLHSTLIIVDIIRPYFYSWWYLIL